MEKSIEKYISIIDMLCLPNELLNETYNIGLVLHCLFNLPLPNYISEIKVDLRNNIYGFSDNNTPTNYVRDHNDKEQIIYKSNDNMKITLNNLNLQYNKVDYNFIWTKDILNKCRNFFVKFKKNILKYDNILQKEYKNCIRDNIKIDKHYGLLYNIEHKKYHKSLLTSKVNYNSISSINQEKNIEFTYIILNKLLNSYIKYIDTILEVCDTNKLQTNTFKQTVFNFINKKDYNLVLEDIIFINEDNIKIFCPYIRDISIMYAKKEKFYYKSTYIEYTKVDSNNRWEFLFGKSILDSDIIKDKNILNRLLELDKLYTNDKLVTTQSPPQSPSLYPN
jgi:hypothetical protein